MNLLLYKNARNGAGEHLQNVIETLVPEKKIEIYTTIDSLYQRLRKPTFDVAVAVLLAATRKELLEIYSMKDLFRDIRIILILPDTEGDTVSMGFKLFPRFVSYADGNFKDVAAVLEKMLGNGYLANGSNINQTKRRMSAPYRDKLNLEESRGYFNTETQGQMLGLLQYQITAQ